MSEREQDLLAQRSEVPTEFLGDQEKGVLRSLRIDPAKFAAVIRAAIESGAGRCRRVIVSGEDVRLDE